MNFGRKTKAKLGFSAKGEESRCPPPPLQFGGKRVGRPAVFSGHQRPDSAVLSHVLPAPSEWPIPALLSAQIEPFCFTLKQGETYYTRCFIPGSSRRHTPPLSPVPVRGSPTVAEGNPARPAVHALGAGVSCYLRPRGLRDAPGRGGGVSGVRPAAVMSVVYSSVPPVPPPSLQPLFR